MKIKLSPFILLSILLFPEKVDACSGILKEFPQISKRIFVSTQLSKYPNLRNSGIMSYSTLSKNLSAEHLKVHYHLKTTKIFTEKDISNIQVENLEGWTNENYHIKSDKGSFVLRIPRQNSNQFLDRAAEKKNYDIASKLSITPHYSFFDDVTGVLVRPYLKGEVPVDDNDYVKTPYLRQMAQILKKLHQGIPTFQNEVDNLEVIASYKSLIEKGKGLWTKRHQQILDEMNSIKKVLNSCPFPKVSCHNDPNPRNFLLQPDGTIVLLDFEYSGLGNPFFDLAYLSTHANIKEEQEKELFQAYFGVQEPKKEEIAQYHLLKPYTEYILGVWLRMQLTMRNHPISPEEMEDWEELCLEQTEKLINNSFYEQSRQLLSQKMF